MARIQSLEAAFEKVKLAQELVLEAERHLKTDWDSGPPGDLDPGMKYEYITIHRKAQEELNAADLALGSLSAWVTDLLDWCR